MYLTKTGRLANIILMYNANIDYNEYRIWRCKDRIILKYVVHTNCSKMKTAVDDLMST